MAEILEITGNFAVRDPIEDYLAAFPPENPPTDQPAGADKVFTEALDILIRAPQSDPTHDGSNPHCLNIQLPPILYETRRGTGRVALVGSVLEMPGITYPEDVEFELGDGSKMFVNQKASDISVLISGIEHWQNPVPIFHILYDGLTRVYPLGVNTARSAQPASQGDANYATSLMRQMRKAYKVPEKAKAKPVATV